MVLKGTVLSGSLTWLPETPLLMVLSRHWWFVVGVDTTSSDFLLCIVFGIEFLAVCFGCLALTFIGSSMVVLCGVDDVLQWAVFHFLYGQCGPCVFQCIWGLGFC